MLSFLLTTLTYGQQVKVTDTSISDIKSLDKVASSYLILELQLSDLKNLKSQSGFLELKLDIDKNTSWNLRLENSQVLPPNGRYRLLADNAELTIPDIDIVTYHGYLENDANSSAAVTMADDYLSVYVSSQDGSYVLEPLDLYEKAAKSNQFVFYDIKDIHKENKYQCQKADLLSEINEKTIERQSKNLACYDIELAIAVDHLMYVSEGSSASNVLNALASVYNLVSLDFDNEFNHQLNIRIKEVVIATCPACDPWSKTSNVGHALDAIRHWGESGGFNETYDIGIYWTSRVYDDGFAGLAFQDQICGVQRYIAVRKYTPNNQALRVMMSHEIGHSLGCGHNYEIGSACGNNPNRGPKIMDPIVNASSIGWTNGTQSCDMNSTAVINAKIGSATCLETCASISCSSITNLNVTNVTQNGLSANWAGTGSSYLVRVKKEGTSNYIYSSTTSSSSVNVNANLDYCEQYHVSVKALCGGSNDPAAITEIVEIDGGTKMDILYVEPKNCDNGSYDLEVVVSYQNTVPGGFRIVANGSMQIFSYTSSPQTVTLIGLNSANDPNALLEAYGTSKSDLPCRGMTTYTEPNGACEIVICEDFNSCELPFEWIATSSNSNVFSENYEWKFNDGDRNILNYGAANNAGTSLTIDGTCAAYFDDDIFMNNDYTGNITLESRSYDLTNMTNIEIELDYNFHKFVEGKMTGNNSQFSIDLFNGTAWTNVMFDNNDSCPWYNVWQSVCTTNFVMDVTSFMSSQFKVRLNYTDGNSGDWTGMIMIDNFKVKGVQLPVLDLKILDFQGKLNSEVIELDWDIELDESFSHYVIERSADGRSFEKLGELNDGSQYVDVAPLHGANYYKLIMYDNDGERIESDMIMIENNVKEVLALYPNPSNEDKVTIVNTTDVKYDQLMIYSIDGKLVNRHSLMNATHNKLDISSLSEGIYLMRMSNNTSSKTLRLVKL